jgi:carbon storage regulator
MLVLARKLGEQIIIDGNIRVKVLALKGSSIRLGIEAPADVEIKRLELLAKTSADASMSETERNPKCEPNSDPAEPFST